MACRRWSGSSRRSRGRSAVSPPAPCGVGATPWSPASASLGSRSRRSVPPRPLRSWMLLWGVTTPSSNCRRTALSPTASWSPSGFSTTPRRPSRCVGTTMHPHWRRKWAWLRANEKLPDVDGAVYWVRSVGRPAEALFAELLIDPKPVCLAFEEPPPIVQDLGNDELAVGLYAGTPVMIWCRGGRGSGRFRAEMSAQLAGRALFDLPEITLRLRREAVRLDQETDHLGLQITLLWDDPDRIPEPFAPLKAPA